ncbi:MAG: hypothetical protein HY791_03365 [Deltaproteobacteria bacterium]|nr:hypothetical protein [Deltaproteobacteria bacterium]
MSKPPPKSDDEAPWRKGGEVKGIVPPGRRLASEARANTWSASGVRGVSPPGTLKPGEGAATRWILEAEQRSGKKKPKAAAKPNDEKAAKKKSEKNSNSGTPAEPKNLKEFLDQIADFTREGLPKDHAMIAELLSFVGQSSRPFEIIVAFAVGSALIGSDQKLRSEHQWALERGAKAFFNLAKRLDKSVRAPRGLVPETLDPLFYDLPEISLQIPFPYMVRAFLDQLDLLRVDLPHDRKLIRFAKSLYARFIENRSYGDRRLSSMFPWEPPEWAPIEDED